MLKGGLLSSIGVVSSFFFFETCPAHRDKGPTEGGFAVLVGCGLSRVSGGDNTAAGFGEP